MRIYRIADSTRTRLIAEDDDRLYDLTSSDESVRRFSDLCDAADTVGQSIEDVSRGLFPAAKEFDPERLSNAAQPVLADEVWAAGVTYKISEEAREAESGMPEMYLDVYEGERPEVFFKATPNRTVGPGDDVGIRGDSDWDVPEPELGVVLYKGDIVGYTIGNDMSSRSIEGENPLYLPQAKVYDRCCSLGPCVATPESISDPHDLEISMEIERDGEIMYDESASTGEMIRTCEELVSYYTRHNKLPDVSVLLTGTSLVPQNDFTLAEDDEVTIEIEDIGTLQNPVSTV